MSFQLDTSGAVERVSGHDYSNTDSIMWPDLDAFTQGYVEALLRSLHVSRIQDDIFEFDADGREEFGFRHVASETLATIIRDCDEMQAALANFNMGYSQGWCFWNYRKRRLEGPDMVRWAEPLDTLFLNAARELLPQVPTVGDDGLIRFTD